MASDHLATCPVCAGTGTIAVPIGIRIEALRKRLELTQEAFAMSVGMSRPSLANIEAGRQDVPLKFVVAISRVHGVTADWLLGMEQSP
jgi:transcriptional regulator with XRE-family HTH domain